MPSNFTPNYSLNQWEPGDKVLRMDFNADNARIDAALKEEADARTSAVAALTSQVEGKGNCRIYAMTYRGTGKFGEAHQSILHFPKQPLVVFISSPDGVQAMFMPHQTEGFAQAGNSPILSVSWSDSVVRWYSHQSALGQMNEEGITYRAVALIAM